MAITKEVLGMNARNFLYIRKYNTQKAKRIADDKLETKKLFLKHKIPTAPLIGVLNNRDNIFNFDWNKLKGGFAVKPARGYGGGGILIFKSFKTEFGITTLDKIYSKKELESHLLDILEGVYSLQFLPDKAFLEQRVLPHPFFKKLYPKGIADIRVIVFNTVPVMAMMRLPTDESLGKANYSLGAIILGIDLRTGITTNARTKDQVITYFPGIKIKAKGIKIPYWNEILLLATQTQSICGLGFVGVDIVIDAKMGPLVLEINARPGLAIQKANNTSLRTRLERVEDIKPPSPHRGVELSKSLFAEHFFDKVEIEPKVLSVIEPITIKKGNLTRKVQAKLDTGAFRTSLDLKLAKELKLKIIPKKILVESASGKQLRMAVKINFELAGKKISTIATITKRSHLKYPIIVGRTDMDGFLIKPLLNNEVEQNST